MIKHKAFAASCSLAELEAAMNELDGPRKALIGIGNQAGETIGSYDRDKKGNRKIILRPGKPIPVPPGTVIDTDIVYITGQLQTVTAYRASDAD